MSADIKWEAVEYGDLKPGDGVRLTQYDDVIHGHVTTDLCIGTAATSVSIGIWRNRGYSVERAVPERTLPTEAGYYLAGDTLFRLYADGQWWKPFYEDKGWRLVDEDDVPDDLVRLVPVTEVEELRQRIEKADEYLAAQHREAEIGDVRPTLTSLLYGEATDV